MAAYPVKGSSMEIVTGSGNASTPTTMLRPDVVGPNGPSLQIVRWTFLERFSARETPREYRGKGEGAEPRVRHWSAWDFAEEAPKLFFDMEAK
jgi:hypothetical protein